MSNNEPSLNKLNSLREASVLVHELSNPLSVLNLKIEKLLNTQLDSNQHKLANDLLRSTERINEIVQSTKNSIQARPQKPTNHASLTEICQDSIFFTLNKCRKAQVEVVFEAVDEYFIHACPIQISQVLINLINNATHAYLKNESSAEGKKIFLSIEEQKPHVFIRCQDHAGGVSASLKEKMFQPTKPKVDPTTTNMGIGLSICKELIEKNDGTIHYNATKNGSSFEILLPLA